MDEKKGIQPLSLLIAVCDRGEEKKMTELFKGRSTSFNLMAMGKGTANSKILNYLGLGKHDKTVLFSVMPVMEGEDLLQQMEWTLDLKKPGHGIAFTLPLSGACSKSFTPVLPGSPRESKAPEDSKERGEEKMGCLTEYELIIVIANRGFDQEVMDAARTAKATGGTILNAKGFALSGGEKFFGLTLQAEKEIIIILAQSDRRTDIMNAIAGKAGPGTPAGAVSFSLPVSGVEGLQTYLADVEE